MLTEHYTKAKKDLMQFVSKCRELGERFGDKTLSKTFDSLARELNDLTFNIAIVGSIKRGKSTLINTLLGRRDDDISPVGLTVCTSAITKFRNYTDDVPHEPHALVEYEEGSRPTVRITYDELRELVSQKYNPDNEKGIRCITVYGDFPALGACCLVDTPGADACIERHGEMVSEILPSADAIIMPIMGTEAWTNSEQEMLCSLAENTQRRIFYVITKADKVSAEDLKEVRDYTYEHIARAGMPRPSQIYSVSAKTVFDALKRGAGDEEIARLSRDCGIKKLEDDLSQFMTQNSVQGADLTRRLTQAVNAARGMLEQRRGTNAAFISGQIGDREQIREDISRAREEFNIFRKEIDKKLKNFERNWDRACDQGLERMDSVIERVADVLREQFDKGGYFASFKNAFKLRSLVASKVAREIQPMVDSLHDKLEKVLAKLDEEYADACNLYAKRVEGALPVTATLGVLTVGGGAATTIVALTVPAIQGVAAAASAWVTAGAGVAAAEASAAGLPAMLGSAWAWVTGSSTAVTAANTAAGAAASALTGSIMAAVLPIGIGVAALAAAGPVAKMIVGGRTESAVRSTVEKSKKDIRRRLDKARDEVIDNCQKILDVKQEELEAKIDELRERLENLSPEDRKRAEAENATIDTILNEGKGLVCSIKLLN